jgi:hypothetical protein
MTWQKGIKPADLKFYKITRFSPDTCGCVLEFAWDSRSSEDGRKHLPADIVHACKHHEHHVKDGKKVEEHHHEVFAENRHKNEVLAHVLENLDEEHVEIVKDTANNDMRQFKKHPRWSFNDKRELVVELDDVAAGHCKEIASQVGKQFKTRKTHIK